MSKQKQKPGKVLRVSKALWLLMQEKRKAPSETNDAVLRRLIGLSGKKGTPPECRTLYALPSELSETMAEAKGRAVMIAVRRKKTPEKPIVVREVV